MTPCKCRNYAAVFDGFPGGNIHAIYWFRTRDAGAHHPACEKFNELQQLRLVERWLEKQQTRIRDMIRKGERKALQHVVRRKGLKLV